MSPRASDHESKTASALYEQQQTFDDPIDVLPLPGFPDVLPSARAPADDFAHHRLG